MRVLIIGAGMGGLTLAHGLRKAGVDVAVFERNSENSDGLAGFGIHLNRHGYGALQRCLPPENWAEFDRVAGRPGALTRFYDEKLQLLAVIDGNDPQPGGIGERRSVGRLELRDILLQGLTHETGGDDVVRWGTKFVSYEHTADGQIRARFDDGTEAIGDLLIGADGSNSKVRAQRLPQLERIDLEVINIAGRSSLTPERMAAWPKALVDGSPNSIASKHSDWLFASAWRGQHEPDASGKTPHSDYVLWAYVSAKKNLPAELLDWNGEQQLALVRERIQGWAPELREIVAAADVATISPIPLKTMPTLPEWASDNVTLLGDAIHNMTPMAGIGANTALRDAELLRTVILDIEAGRVPLIAGVQAYERTMREYANRALKASTRNAVNAASDARTSRTIFRRLLRVAQAFPPLKRRMIGSAAA